MSFGLVTRSFPRKREFIPEIDKPRFHEKSIDRAELSTPGPA
jgi:hypothetical protein